MKVLNYTMVILFMACSTKKQQEEPSNLENEIGNEKKVFFKWPKDGSTVASPVFIDMGIEGMIVEPAGVVKDGYGHHHILINQSYWPEGQVIPTSDSTLHYGLGQTDASIDLDPGKYIISLQFADGVHASYGESMSHSIEINVE